MNDFKVIQVFMYPQDAYLAKAFLESEGIPVFLQDELTTQVFNFYSNAIGGVKMLVPSTEEEKAVELLKEGGFVLTKEETEEIIEVISLTKEKNKKHCPYCHSTNIGEERKPNFLTITLIFLLGLILPITSKTFVCFECTKKWKWRKHR